MGKSMKFRAKYEFVEKPLIKRNLENLIRFAAFFLTSNIFADILSFQKISKKIFWDNILLKIDCKNLSSLKF